MPLAEIIEAGGILLHAECETFEDAVRALVNRLVERGRLDESLSEAAVEAVCGREQMASTAMVEIGVSIPHARLAGVNGVVGAIAVSPTAVYHAMASVPISIVALILSAPERAGEHLNVLAGLSIFLQSESARRELEQATDVTAALAILRSGSGPFP